MRILKRTRKPKIVQANYPVGSIIKCSRGNCYIQSKDGSLRKIVSVISRDGNLAIVLKNGSIITVVGKT